MRLSPVMSDRFNKVETDLAVLKWMTGAVAAVVIALVLKGFS